MSIYLFVINHSPTRLPCYNLSNVLNKSIGTRSFYRFSAMSWLCRKQNFVAIYLWHGCCQYANAGVPQMDGGNPYPYITATLAVTQSYHVCMFQLCIICRIRMASVKMYTAICSSRLAVTRMVFKDISCAGHPCWTKIRSLSWIQQPSQPILKTRRRLGKALTRTMTVWIP